MRRNSIPFRWNGMTWEPSQPGARAFQLVVRCPQCRTPIDRFRDDAERPGAVIGESLCGCRVELPRHLAEGWKGELQVCRGAGRQREFSLEQACVLQAATEPAHFTPLAPRS